ncbi:MAG: site-specific DNA-methyltransferase [Chloroflexota bacterium]|nr:site-specific DNA-methyltransferase [Chloroflexota bacterium]
MTTKRNQVLKIEYVAVETLRIDPGNPRRITDADEEALARSIEEFGLVDPLIADSRTRKIIGGHLRARTAIRLGMKTVPVIFVDVGPEQSRLLSVALNKIGGTWDEELLARLFSELPPEADLTLTGFESDAIEKLMRSLDVRDKRDRPETFDVEAAIAAARAAARVQRGEIWDVNGHRIMCGDATDDGDVAPLLDGVRPAMCFTDPPYNVSLGDHGGQPRESRRRRIQNDALPPEQWAAFCRNLARTVITSVDGAIYVCMSTKEWPSVSQALAEAGGHGSDTIIWVKDRFVMGRADYQRQFEPIWYGWREGAKHQWYGGRDQGDVWEIARPSESEAHPTMKPLALVERAITNSSKPGDVVLDLFLGSGTTLIAAERTGRVCYGMELDPHYASVSVARLEAFTGVEATRVLAAAATKEHAPKERDGGGL